MTVDADVVASALADTWVHLLAAVPHGWVRREGGLLGAVTGVALPSLNGVWPVRVDLDPHLVSEILDEVGSSGLPHCLQIRPGTSEQLAELAARRGMVRQEVIPLMLFDDAGLESPHSDDLEIRQLTPQEAALHAATAARGFGAPPEPFAQLMTPAVLGRPGVRCYVGELDGEAVATGVGVTVGPFVGIFNVATDPDHRRRGFGASITARAVADGLAEDAQWSYLQSSAEGFNVYERLGFATLERWDCWETPS